MYGIFSDIGNFLKVSEVRIENNIFFLHYKVTFILLVAFSLLGTQKQYFGDPIDCLGGDGGGDDFIDTFCWIHSTYTIKGVNDLYPGVSHNQKGKELKYHTYYQWVSLFVFLQVSLSIKFIIKKS